MTGFRLLVRRAIVSIREGTSAWRWLLLSLGAALGLLNAARCLPLLLAHGIDWPIHVEGEVATLATYGKWWVLPPHRYLTDGFSGAMPVYYAYVSDTLVNLLASPGDWPSITVQVALYGPILAALFFWGNVASLLLVTHERVTSLVGALLLSLSSGSALLGLVVSSDQAAVYTSALHVPVKVLSLGTSQSLGWVFFLPALASFHAALERFTPRRATVCGILTGLMPHVHTLTFVNMAFGQICCATATNAFAVPVGRRRRLWCAGLVILGGSFLVRAASAPLSTAVLATFGFLALIVNLAVARNRRTYLWVYGLAGLVALPYALAVVRTPALALMTRQVGGIEVPPGIALVFFAPQLLAALLSARAGVPRSALVFLGSLLAATACLSLNQLWGWNNHPYRFAINLIFPLCGLAALGLTRGPRRPAFVAGAWLGSIVVLNVARLASGAGSPVALYGGSAGTAEFLATVREVTAASPPDTRLLNPPEYDYPHGVAANAMLFSYSRRPGFIPDYRYLLGNTRYFNRLALFCFLFPDFPAVDVHLRDRHACDEDLAPPQDLFRLRETRLRASILPVYGLRYAVALGNPFSGSLASSEARHGWKLLAELGHRRRLVQLDAPDLPGLARMQPLREDALGQAFPFDVERDGDYLFGLGGRSLRERVDHVSLDGQDVAEGVWRGNWALLRAPLHAGKHELLLARAGRDAASGRDVLYFITIVERRFAARYLELADNLERRRASPAVER